MFCRGSTARGLCHSEESDEQSKRGKKNGAHIKYDENGKEVERVNYRNDLKEGTSDGVKYKKNKKGKVYRFRISETDNDVKIEKERVK